MTCAEAGPPVGLLPAGTAGAAPPLAGAAIEVPNSAIDADKSCSGINKSES